MTWFRRCRNLSWGAAMVRFLIFVVSFLFHTSVFADFLGSLEHIDASPGYIDNDRHSPWFKGVYRIPDYRDGVEHRLPSELVLDQFKDGRFDPTELERRIAEVEKQRRQTFIAFCMEKLPKEAKDNTYCTGEVTDKKLLKKWKEDKFNLAFQFTVTKLREAITLGVSVTPETINFPSSQKFLSTLFTALQVWEGLMDEDQQRGLHTGMNHLFANVANFMFPDLKIEDNREEAANLLVPETYRRVFQNQRFLSRDDLKKLEKQGYDLSDLEPNESGMWRKPTVSISSYDLSNYNRTGIDSLTHLMSKQEAEAMGDPTVPVDFVYKPTKLGSGSTPKIYGTLGGKGPKWKLKLLVDKVSNAYKTDLRSVMEILLSAAEVNAESVANNLAAAIGFTVDPTYFKRKVRLFFDVEVYEKGSFEEAYQALMDELSGSDIEGVYIKSALQTIKVDETTGRKYIELTAVGLEKKSDDETDLSLGLFNKDGLGKSLQREHRAFALFSAWIDDPDVKNRNVQTKIIPQSDKGDFKVAFSNSDLGGSLGHGLPNFLPKTLVHSVHKNLKGEVSSFQIKFRRLFSYPIMDALTFNDARWLVKRIAQLTFPQLERAFAAAGYPEIIAKVYAQKMMGRRNQLVEVLGLMGTTIIDDEGKPFEIKEEESYTGSIPGYERFFENGYVIDKNDELFDPEREPFPRQWGAFWTPQVRGETQMLVWKHFGMMFLNTSGSMIVNSLQPGFYFTDHNLGFSKMRMGSHTLDQGCAGNCFFQGVSAGVGSFIPFRFIVENPDKESKEPFLIIDTFRIGVFVGNDGLFIPKLLNLDVPSQIGLGVGGRFFYVWEFMKVRAVKDFAEYSNGMPSFKEGVKMAFETAKQQFVESMEEGDSLILSTYLGALGRVRTRPPIPFVPLVGPEARVEGQKVLTSRMILTKEGANNFLANWVKIDDSSLQAAANLRVGIPLNLMRLATSRMKARENSYMFDFANEEEKKTLLGNLHISEPEKLPKHLKMQNRREKLKQNQFSIGLFDFINTKMFSRKSEVNFYNFLDKTSAREISYERETAHRRAYTLATKKRSYIYKASINDQNDAFVRVSATLHQPEARERHFIRILDQMKPLLTDDFIVFDPTAVKNYLGEFEFEADVVLSNQALETIFAQRDEDVCGKFAEINEIHSSFCANENYGKDLRLWTFMKDYKQGRENFIRLKLTNVLRAKGEGAHSRQTIRYLRQLVDIFSRYNNHRSVIKTFRSFLPKESYYQYAKMSSHLNGFPNDMEEIETNPSSRGGFKPKARHLAEGPEDVFTMFSDDLKEKVEPYFFNDGSALE